MSEIIIEPGNDRTGSSTGVDDHIYKVRSILSRLPIKPTFENSYFRDSKHVRIQWTQSEYNTNCQKNNFGIRIAWIWSLRRESLQIARTMFHWQVSAIRYLFSFIETLCDASRPRIYFSDRRYQFLKRSRSNLWTFTEHRTVETKVGLIRSSLRNLTWIFKTQIREQSSFIQSDVQNNIFCIEYNQLVVRESNNKVDRSRLECAFSILRPVGLIWSGPYLFPNAHAIWVRKLILISSRHTFNFYRACP